MVGNDLHKNFGKTEALRGAGIEVDRGEIVAIMGPSGSGKSTLLHCLAGVLQPDSGSVLFDGQDLASMADDERSLLRRRRFGFVFQFGQLVNELSAVENVMLPLLLERIPRPESAERSRAWLDRLGIGDLAKSRPSEMSGGQAQRVAVARAMVIEPDVIFADEPTGALDSLAGEVVMESLTDAAETSGAALIIVTHDPRVAAYASREVIVRDGRATAGAHR